MIGSQIAPSNLRTTLQEVTYMTLDVSDACMFKLHDTYHELGDLFDFLCAA